MSKSAALFDLDGTLVDSNDQHVEVWRQVFAKEGLILDEAAIHAEVGKGADKLVPALMKSASEEDIKRLGDAHGEMFKSRYLRDMKPFPSAHALLEHVHGSGRMVVIASSAGEEEVKHYIKLLDAQALVEGYTSIDDVEASKPAPDIFAAALKKMGLTAEEAIAIGDSPFDVEAAARCNVAAIALRSGKFPAEVLHHAGPIAIYDDVAQLLEQYDRSPLGKSSSSS